MILVKLTGYAGKHEFFVQGEAIRIFYREEGYTKVEFDNTHWVKVAETPAQIHQKMRDAGIIQT